jgi:hypothetical protein
VGVMTGKVPAPPPERRLQGGFRQGPHDPQGTVPPPTPQGSGGLPRPNLRRPRPGGGRLLGTRRPAGPPPLRPGAARRAAQRGRSGVGEEGTPRASGDGPRGSDHLPVEHRPGPLRLGLAGARARARSASSRPTCLSPTMARRDANSTWKTGRSQPWVGASATRSRRLGSSRSPATARARSSARSRTVEGGFGDPEEGLHAASQLGVQTGLRHDEEGQGELGIVGRRQFQVARRRLQRFGGLIQGQGRVGPQEEGQGRAPGGGEPGFHFRGPGPGCPRIPGCQAIRTLRQEAGHFRLGGGIPDLSGQRRGVHRLRHGGGGGAVPTRVQPVARKRVRNAAQKPGPQ